MRFSLRTLLLLFPAILLAYGLSYVEASLYYIDTHQEANSAFTKVETNTQDFANHLQANPAAIDVDLLNQWLDNKLPPNNPQGMVYDAIPGPVYRRPVKAVALDAQGNPLPDQRLAERIGFYIRRNDVVPTVDLSTVQGLNANTINSWNTTRGEARAIDRQKIHHRIQGRAISNWPWAITLSILAAVTLVPFSDWLRQKVSLLFQKDDSVPHADKVWPLS